MLHSLLDKQKEPTPYFHLSLSQENTSDMLHLMSGFYKVPTLAYYGAGYPFGDMVGLIAAPGEVINLPEYITNLVYNAPEEIEYQREPTKTGKVFDPVRIHTYRPKGIKFYWVVCDISELVHKVITNFRKEKSSIW